MRVPHGVLPKVCRVVPRHSVAITTCASPRSMPLCPASRAVVAPDRNVATRHCVGAPTRPPYTRPGAPPHARHGWRDSRAAGHCHAPTAPAPPGRLTPSRYTAPIPATRPPGRPPSVGLPPAHFDTNSPGPPTPYGLATAPHTACPSDQSLSPTKQYDVHRNASAPPSSPSPDDSSPAPVAPSTCRRVSTSRSPRLSSACAEATGTSNSSP